jgi:class 3 adenylate cyclase
MVDDGRIDGGATTYRGFLFSDVRGFTAFAERYGNSAAAAMVGRFLELARKAIARHGGAEITTEGDAIHAVFSSASSAVLCGLEIQDAAAELNAREPGRPIGLGVGIHAGEAVETAEGYIGRAVNIAARLCAVARPGEVLVSSTVKGITQASITVGFIPRGRKRLKGIEDPILVYAVTRDTTARAPRVPRPVVLGASGVAVAAVVAIAAIVGLQGFGNPRSSASPSAAPTAQPQPVVIGPLPIGTYASQAFQPPVTFDIGDLGWIANRDNADALALIRDESPRGTVTFLRVGQVFTNPCVAEGEGAQTGLGASDLFAALAGIGHLTLSSSQAVQVGGYPGQQAEITVDQDALAACGGLAGAEVPVFGAGDEVWSAASSERFRLISVDVAGQTVTILLAADYTQTPSTQELENLLELGQRVVDSVGF